MEQNDTNNHRFVYHLEVIITIVALGLIAFGLYTTTFGQTGGDPTYVGNVDPRVRTGQFYPAGTNTTTTGGIGIDPNAYGPSGYGVDPNKSQVVPYTTTGSTPGTRGSSWGTTTGGRGSASGTSSGTTTGGSGYTTSGNTVAGGYYGTTGGYYTGGGIIDPNPYQTQGGYGSGKGSGYYSGSGIIEGGAVRTQGTQINSGAGVFEQRGITEGGATLNTPTAQTTLSVKHCEFITKYHKFGDRGGDVPKIQQFLKDRGYYTGRIDGVYGYSTFRAVRAFQKDYASQILEPWDFNGKERVEGTGITNVSTKYAINKMVGCPDPATIVPKTGKILNY